MICILFNSLKCVLKMGMKIDGAVTLTKMGFFLNHQCDLELSL